MLTSNILHWKYIWVHIDCLLFSTIKVHFLNLFTNSVNLYFITLMKYQKNQVLYSWGYVWFKVKDWSYTHIYRFKIIIYNDFFGSISVSNTNWTIFNIILKRKTLNENKQKYPFSFLRKIFQINIIVDMSPILEKNTTEFH